MKRTGGHQGEMGLWKVCVTEDAKGLKMCLRHTHTNPNYCFVSSGCGILKKPNLAEQQRKRQLDKICKGRR